MISWELRATEVAHYYNPAYVGRLLKEFINAYENEKPEGVPYELTFIALPLVILKSFRLALPRTIRTQLHNWIEENSDYKVEFAATVKELIPIVKETLIFLLQKNLLIINDNGKLVIGSERLNRKYHRDTEEILESIDKAKFMGKWFAKAGEVTTIYALWGIRP